MIKKKPTCITILLLLTSQIYVLKAIQREFSNRLITSVCITLSNTYFLESYFLIH